MVRDQLDHGFIVVHQAKLHTNKKGKPKPELRIVPLQESLRPWLEELKQQSGIDDPESEEFVFQLGPADERPTRRPRMRPTMDTANPTSAIANSVIARAARTLVYAGVKPDRYSTHWGRATHASWAKHAVNVKSEEVLHFLGHAAYDGSTEAYLTMLIGMVRDDHRRYIQLPTPDEVRAAAPGFAPKTAEWRAWRAKFYRAKEDREERSRRAGRKPLGAYPATEL
jgi:integrase